VVDLLLSRLVEYNASAVPPIYPPNNRLSNPNMRGGFWIPWKNMDEGVSRKHNSTRKFTKKKKINRRFMYPRKKYYKFRGWKNKRRKRKYQRQYFKSSPKTLTVQLLH